MTHQPTDNVSSPQDGAVDKPAVLGSASPVLRHSGEEGDGYDPDEWVGDMDYGDELLGYQCIRCGHTQARNGWGGRCDRCDGLSLEEMYG